MSTIHGATCFGHHCLIVDRFTATHLPSLSMSLETLFEFPLTLPSPLLTLLSLPSILRLHRWKSIFRNIHDTLNELYLDGYLDDSNWLSGRKIVLVDIWTNWNERRTLVLGKVEFPRVIVWWFARCSTLLFNWMVLGLLCLTGRRYLTNCMYCIQQS